MSSPLSASLEAILDRFDEAWNGPTPPRIEDYLAQADPDRRLSLLIELVRIDLERRLVRGERARLEEVYMPRFPELFDDSPAIISLAKHEYAVRRCNEPELRPAEYLARFPQYQKDLLAQMPTLDESREGQPQQQTADSPLGLDLRGYEFIETLGKGGMGEVYRCVDPALGRDLAIKVMMAAHRGHSERESRFLREARVTGSLQHPGIVPIHNLGRLRDGRLHYTMRLVRGRTFAEILHDDAGKPERLPYLLSIFERICQAVAYAHSKHVIHRDLKPSNVMVGRFGEVQVMDWGLAKVLTPGDAATETEETMVAAGTRIFTESGDTPVDQSRMGFGFGTLPYMPSEQARGKWDAVDERADVFALGSILCEMLTGQPAYIGTSEKELCDRAERGDITETLERLQRCGADEALTTLCRECLSPHREERPRDAAVVAKRVAEHQAEVQERLRRAEVERAEAQLKAREGRKQRRLLIFLVVALLGIAALATWLAVLKTAMADAERLAKEAETAKRELAEEQERRAKENELRVKEAEDTTRMVQDFFQEKVFSAGRPQAQETGLGKDVSLRKAVDAAEKDIAKWFTDKPLLEASMRNTLGTSYGYLGEIAKAIQQHERALELRESKLGSDHLDTLKCRNNLAIAYYAAGPIDAAIRLHKQTLEVREAKLGPDDPDTLKSRNNLAAAYWKAGRIADAIPLFELALKQRQAKLGTNHPDTLKSLNNLATGYLRAGRIDEAIGHLEEALRRRKEILGLSHPETLVSMANLGVIYRDAGRSRDAVPLLEEALARGRKLSGGLPYSLAGLPAVLGEMYVRIGQFAKSEPLLRESLKVCETKQPDDWTTFNARSLLGAALLGQKKYAEAEPLLLQGYEGMKARQGKIPPQERIRLTEALERLVQLYEATDQKDKAADWRKKLQEAKDAQSKPKR